MEGIIGKVEAKLGDDVKATVAEYIRLVQLKQELEQDDPRDIEVRWVDEETQDPDEEK